MRPGDIKVRELRVATEGRGFSPLLCRFLVTTWESCSHTHMFLCHQAVDISTGQEALMPCGWGANRRSGIALALYFRLSAFSDLYWVCLSVFSCTVLFAATSQVIGCEDHLRNDLYCVGWGVKLYSNQTKHRTGYASQTSCLSIRGLAVSGREMSTLPTLLTLFYTYVCPCMWQAWCVYVCLSVCSSAVGVDLHWRLVQWNDSSYHRSALTYT